jgi:hypothetical protein
MNPSCLGGCIGSGKQPKMASSFIIIMF